VLLSEALSGLELAPIFLLAPALESVMVASCGLQHLEENENGQLVKGVCPRCVIRHHQGDLLTGIVEVIPFGLVAAPRRSHDQSKTLFRRQTGVVLRHRFSFHSCLSFPMSGGVWRVAPRRSSRQPVRRSSIVTSFLPS